MAKDLFNIQIKVSILVTFQTISQMATDFYNMNLNTTLVIFKMEACRVMVYGKIKKDKNMSGDGN